MNEVLVPKKSHQLPGLEDIQYLYNREQKELVINHNGVEIIRYTNGEALKIYTLATDDDFYSMQEVIALICQFYNFTYEDIVSRTRRQDVSDARCVFARFSREKLKLTYAEIGKFIERDHSTILHMNKVASEVREVINQYENFVYYAKKTKEDLILANEN